MISKTEKSMKQEKGIRRLGSLLEHRLGVRLSCAQLKMGHYTGLECYLFAYTLSMSIAELLKLIHRKENAVELPYCGHGQELEHSSIAVQQSFDLSF